MPGLIVTDLDGTLLDRRGHVSPRNRAALKAAHDAGWHVAIATGRTWSESHRAIDCIAEDAYFIGVGGASLHEAGSGRVLATTTIDAATSLAVAETIIGHGHRAHVLMDPSVAGHDYLFVGTAELDAATTWWLDEHPVTRRDWHAAPADAHEHLEGRVLRVGTIGPESEITPLVRMLSERWASAWPCARGARSPPSRPPAFPRTCWRSSRRARTSGPWRALPPTGLAWIARRS